MNGERAIHHRREATNVCHYLIKKKTRNGAYAIDPLVL